MKLIYENLKEKLSLNTTQGHSRSKIHKRSEYSKLKLNGLYKDHPPAWVISDPASVRVN